MPGSPPKRTELPSSGSLLVCDAWSSGSAITTFDFPERKWAEVFHVLIRRYALPSWCSSGPRVNVAQYASVVVSFNHEILFYLGSG